MKDNKKTISLVCLTCHFFITLIVNCSDDLIAGGFMNIAGAIGSTVGLSVIVIVTYMLLYFKKIDKIGSIVGLSLQVISSIGQRISHYAVTENENYIVLGIATGIGLNFLFACSLAFLLNIKKWTNKETITLNDDGVQCPENRVIQVKKTTTDSQGFFDFSTEKGEANKQLRQLMNIPEQESIVRVGEMKYKGLSLSYVLVTGLFYAAFIVLSILTKTEGRSRNSIYAPTEYRILGIEIAHKYGLNKDYSLSSGLGLYIFICLVVIGIPFVIYLYKRWLISITKIVITEKNIYVYDTSDSLVNAIISLTTIKNIEYKPNFFISGAENIIITKLSNEKIKINGVRNAKVFISAIIEEYRKNGG